MRKLNDEELAIIAKKEVRMGKRLHADGVEYRTAFPRTTVCILKRPTSGYRSVGPTGNLVVGISMRAKNEEEIEGVGAVHAFVRAIEAL